LRAFEVPIGIEIEILVCFEVAAKLVRSVFDALGVVVVEAPGYVEGMDVGSVCGTSFFADWKASMVVGMVGLGGGWVDGAFGTWGLAEEGLGGAFWFGLCGHGSVSARELTARDERIRVERRIWMLRNGN